MECLVTGLVAVGVGVVLGWLGHKRGLLR